MVTSRQVSVRQNFTAVVDPKTVLEGQRVDLIVELAPEGGSWDKADDETYSVDWRLPAGKRVEEKSSFTQGSITKRARTDGWIVGEEEVVPLSVTVTPESEPDESDTAQVEVRVTTFIPQVSISVDEPDEDKLIEGRDVKLLVEVTNGKQAERILRRHLNLHFDVRANDVELPVERIANSDAAFARFRPDARGTHLITASVTARPGKKL